MRINADSRGKCGQAFRALPAELPLGRALCLSSSVVVIKEHPIFALSRRDCLVLLVIHILVAAPLVVYI